MDGGSRVRIVGVFLVVITAFALSAPAADASGWLNPPPQPASGPGGSEYAYDCARQTGYGSGALSYQLFEPSCPRPGTDRDGPHPVTVFLHGFAATDPAVYIGWIRHLVRHGNVVVFPLFQSGPFDFYPTDNAAYAINASLAELSRPGHVAVDVARLTIIGHSLGGGLALNMGALAGEGKLPRPANIVAVEPEFNLDPAAPGTPDPLGFVRDWSHTPASVRVTIVVGGQDDLVGDESAITAWPRLAHLPPGNRTYVQVRSDYHGPIAMVANHFMPLSLDGIWIPGLFETNAHDFLLWAIADSLIGCPSGADGAACPATPTSIGSWSDGEPMRSAVVLHDGTPGRIGVTAGNAASYVFLPIFEKVRPLCPYLGSFCGTPPPVSPSR